MQETAPEDFVLRTPDGKDTNLQAGDILEYRYVPGHPKTTLELRFLRNDDYLCLFESCGILKIPWDAEFLQATALPRGKVFLHYANQHAHERAAKHGLAIEEMGHPERNVRQFRLTETV